MLRFIYPIARPFLARMWLILRGLTLGVRGVVLDGEGRVLLIRHGYVPGWNFPGGGVEAGETTLEALKRELAEESNVTVTGEPVLHGIFHQPSFSRRDHVLVYAIRAYSWPGPHKPNREIAECAFFPINALPPDMSPGAKRRLTEILDGTPPALTW
ncbi:NUDIX hydrolase [Terrihabitans soli]|uniref:NUDIX hydrolase n=1 Tax=Terrihabitans soli TaxID=708113 RepID=A0A6S6QIL9_9HYPH|nr:NUDIX domain-containing protein [Terrihabitans soli]BCJ90084.1 NUDIX hydrolase [Terrihabitans soli]